MKRELLRTPLFFRATKRLLKINPDAEASVRTVLELLQEDAFDPRLKTHKLGGKWGNCWACSAGYDLRVIFSILKRNKTEAILLEAVGTHDEVY